MLLGGQGWVARHEEQQSSMEPAPKTERRVGIEFRGKTAYSQVADEFVRLSCREYAGWRRDEWAHSPLFICGKILVLNSRCAA
jgi:hypothetical protein